MKAARLHAYGQPLIIEDIPAPVPAADEVIVRVQGAGFCHSDVHVMDGELPVLPKMPMVLGHENAGTVAAIGSKVRSVREGDRVAVYGGWGCRRCSYCVRGVEALCEAPEWVGLSQHDGGYAEYLKVPHEQYLVKLRKLSAQAAAPLTDAALTPYRAVQRALPYFDPEQAVLVVGLGGLGQYGLKLLKLFTPAPIIAVDLDDKKLALATQLGARQTIKPGANLIEQIREATGGRGVCASFDFVGSEATLAACVASTRSLGKVTQVGLAGGTARLKVLENTRFEVTFEATLWGTLKELREVIALAEEGQLAPIAVDTAPLERINDVHDRVKRGALEGRIVITP